MDGVCFCGRSFRWCVFARLDWITKTNTRRQRCENCLGVIPRLKRGNERLVHRQKQQQNVSLVPNKPNSVHKGTEAGEMPKFTETNPRKQTRNTENKVGLQPLQRRREPNLFPIRQRFHQTSHG